LVGTGPDASTGLDSAEGGLAAGRVAPERTGPGVESVANADCAELGRSGRFFIAAFRCAAIASLMDGRAPPTLAFGPRLDVDDAKDGLLGLLGSFSRAIRILSSKPFKKLIC
jgi:hypothetical protein